MAEKKTGGEEHWLEGSLSATLEAGDKPPAFFTAAALDSQLQTERERSSDLAQRLGNLSAANLRLDMDVKEEKLKAKLEVEKRQADHIRWRAEKKALEETSAKTEMAYGEKYQTLKQALDEEKAHRQTVEKNHEEEVRALKAALLAKDEARAALTKAVEAMEEQVRSLKITLDDRNRRIQGFLQGKEM